MAAVVDSDQHLYETRLLWERPLSGPLPALTADMGACNRWCGAGGPGRP